MKPQNYSELRQVSVQHTLQTYYQKCASSLQHFHFPEFITHKKRKNQIIKHKKSHPEQINNKQELNKIIKSEA